MKKLISLLVIIFIITNSLLLEQATAQTPQKLTYQAIIRNSTSTLVVNKQVGIQISILQGSETGTTVYKETQIITTNTFGLVNIEIGGGLGFSTIPWANSTYFIKTEIDPTGGNNYSITGISQLLSVPYALQSKTTEGVASLTQLQIDALPPVAGLIVYNSTSKELIFHDGTLWKSILN